MVKLENQGPEGDLLAKRRQTEVGNSADRHRPFRARCGSGDEPIRLVLVGI